MVAESSAKSKRSAHFWWRGSIGSALLCLIIAAISLAGSRSPAGAVKGGAVVSRASYGYMVEFLIEGRGAKVNTFVATYCSGTLIDPSWVLTAGHCVRDFLDAPADLHMEVGSTIAPSADHVYVEPGWANPHPDNYVNDVALVHLSSPEVSAPVVRLAGSSDASSWDPCGTSRTATGCRSELATTKKVTALGYGCPGPGTTCLAGVLPLRRGLLEVLTYAQLRKAYQSSAVYSPYVQKPYDDMIIGAGVPGGAVDTCNGDSGGPLLDHAGHEIAVTSWASPDTCGLPTPNGVYMQLGAGSARQWIDSKVPAA